MARIKTFSMNAVSDGLCLKGCIVHPDTPCIGIVQLVHGMAEYKERYLPFMEALANAGYVCIIHDLRGHGESVKDRDDLGYFYNLHADFVLQDVKQVSSFIKEEYPNLPFYLFGHSMGSMIVRCYCKRYDDQLDGLIVCGSPSRNPMSKMGKQLVVSMMKAKGDRYRSSFIQQMAFGSFRKKFKEEGSENIWICRDKSVVEAYDAHPLCGFTFTLNGFENLFSLMLDVYDKKGWAMKHRDLPIYFLAGSDDPCILSDKKFLEAVHFMKDRGYTTIEYKLYHGSRHEILNEQNKEEVYQDVIAWLRKAFV